jgi:hypothetical protein
MLLGMNIHSQNLQTRVNSTDLYSSRYKQKLENRCKSFTEGRENSCETAFRKTFEDCKKTVPSIANEIVCLPLKINFICNIEDLVSKPSPANVCDPSNVIDSKFGTEYVELKKFQQKFTAPYGDVSVNYTSQTDRSIKGASEEINENLFYLKALVNLVCAFLVLVYFQVFYG